MPNHDVTCPRCHHTFEPTKPDPSAPLNALITRYDEQADGTPRLSGELHADFTEWAIADGQPPAFTIAKKRLTNRLTSAHGWGWKQTAAGRQYSPPGDRDWWGLRNDQGLLRLLADFQEIPIYRKRERATILQAHFLAYVRSRGLPDGVYVSYLWVARQLVEQHGWSRVQTKHGRSLVPPG